MRRVLQKICLGIGIIVFITMLILVPDTSAAPTNQTINFSARLKSSSGAIVPDGNYNIGFSLYSQASGGSPIWSETYYDTNGPSSGSDNRVRISAGYMTVKLGSLEPLEGIDWNSDLWITLNVGGTDQIGSTSQISWDGEMTPRIKLSAVPYAMNAATLNGLTADKFFQIGDGIQNDISDGDSIAINKTGSGNLVRFQAQGTDIFTLTNSGSIVMGQDHNHSISIADSESGAGRSLTLAAGSAADGSSLNGGNVILQGGSGDNGGESGGVIVAASGNDSSQLFQVQNAAGQTILNVDSTTTTLSFGGVDIKQSSGSDSSITADSDLSISAAGAISLGSSQHPLTLQGSSISLDSADISLGTSESNTTVSGNLRVGQIDASDASALTIGGSNATSILLNSDTVVDGDLEVMGNLSFNSGLSITAGSAESQGFRVQNSSGGSLFAVNATTNRVTIGQAGSDDTVLVLGRKTTSSDPAGVNGAMYYNASTGKFRCHEAGSWRDCLTPMPALQTLSFTEVESDPIDVPGSGFDLAANTKYHYKYVIEADQDQEVQGFSYGVTVPVGAVDNHWCANSTRDANDSSFGGGATSTAYCGTGDASSSTSSSILGSYRHVSTLEGYIQTGLNPGELTLRALITRGFGSGHIERGYGTLQVVQ